LASTPSEIEGTDAIMSGIADERELGTYEEPQDRNQEFYD
jgi:hypothetical protein